MTKLARLPANHEAREIPSADVHRIARAQVRYYAFLSYSHKDQELADWLHRELERFHVPQFACRQADREWRRPETADSDLPRPP